MTMWGTDISWKGVVCRPLVKEGDSTIITVVTDNTPETLRTPEQRLMCSFFEERPYSHWLDRRIWVVMETAIDTLCSSDPTKEHIALALMENDNLRAILGNSAKDCVYCGLPAIDQGKCPHGFPGCMRGDDQMLSRHFGDGYRADQAERQVAKLQLQLIALKAKLGEG